MQSGMTTAKWSMEQSVMFYQPSLSYLPCDPGSSARLPKDLHFDSSVLEAQGDADINEYA